MFGIFKKKGPPQEPPRNMPPVPTWRPDISQPMDEIIERVRFYTNRQRDLAVFAHGTCVLLPDGLPDDEAVSHAKDILAKIFHFHPDMNPLLMKDGNVLVQYNHPAINLVLESVALKNWNLLEDRHLDALTASEVLMTPLGPNKFDAFGMKALFGRCFMFMDAQAPDVLRIARKES